MKTVQMGPLSGFKQRATQVALGLGLAATMALGAVMPASADTAPGSVTISPGTRSAIFHVTTVDEVSTSGFAFPAKNLTGADQVTSASTQIDVTDLLGGSAGWHIQLSTGAFTADGVANLAAAPEVIGSTLTNENGETSTPLTTGWVSASSSIGITSPATIATTPDANINSAYEEGNGVFILTPTVELEIPANTQAAAYTSTFTVAIVAGP